MHELQRRRQLGVVVQALLDVVLDRLDVVVGGALDLLDALGRLGIEAVHERIQALAATSLSGLSSSTPGSAASAFSHSISTRTRARIRPNSEKIGRSASTLAAIAAVERGQGQQSVFGHRVVLRGPDNSTRPAL
jgi:hypothetical protein